MMKEKIKDLVKHYRDEELKEGRKISQIILILRPEKFFELVIEMPEIERCKECFHCYLFNLHLPIIIDDELDENIIASVMSRQDFERKELDKLYKRFSDIFDVR